MYGLFGSHTGVRNGDSTNYVNTNPQTQAPDMLVEPLKLEAVRPRNKAALGLRLRVQDLGFRA